MKALYFRSDRFSISTSQWFNRKNFVPEFHRGHFFYRFSWLSVTVDFFKMSVILNEIVDFLSTNRQTKFWWI